MKTKKIGLLPFAFLVLTIGCDKVEFMKSDTIKPVVEAYLRAGEPISVVVSNQQLFDSEAVDSLRIKNLVIEITTPRGTEALTETESGRYRSATIPVSGESYAMRFVYNNKTISAETTLPPKPVGLTITKDTVRTARGSSAGAIAPTTTVTITWDNPDEKYFQVVMENIEEKPLNINESYSTSRYVRFQPTKKNSVQFTDRSFNYFGQHRITLSALNDEFISMYNDASNNSVNLKSPNTNVTNGLGIFTGITADTTRVVVLQK